MQTREIKDVNGLKVRGVQKTCQHLFIHKQYPDVHRFECVSCGHIELTVDDAIAEVITKNNFVTHVDLKKWAMA